MNCKKCGAEIISGNKFCGVCGEPVSAPENTGYSQQTPPQQSYMGGYMNNSQQPYTAGYANNSQQPYGTNIENGPWNQNSAFNEKPRKPKKNKKPIIIAAILAIVALVAVLAVILVPIVKKAFMSEQEKFAMYDREVVEDALEVLSDVSEEVKAGADYNGVVAINLSDSMQEQLSAYIGDVNSAKIALDMVSNGNSSGFKINLSLGETELATLDIVFDAENEKIYVEAPGLIDGALELDLGALIPDMPSFSALMGTPASIDINDAVIAEVLELVDVAFNATYGMAESKGTLDVDGVSQKCTVHTLKIDQEMACKMAKAFFTQLKKSDSIKDFVYEVVTNYSEFVDFVVTKENISSLIDEMADEVLEELSSIEEYDQENAIVYTIYVDDDKAIGRVIELPGDMKIKLVRAKDGKDVAFEYSFLANFDGFEEGAKITGRGTEDKNGFTGDVSVRFQDYELIKISCDKFKKDDDVLSGSVVISFGSDIGELDVDYEVAAVLSTAKLTLNFDVNSEKSKIGIGVSVMNLDLGEIIFEGASGSKYAPEVPDNVSYSDIETFGENIDVYELIGRLAEAGFNLAGMIG